MVLHKQSIYKFLEERDFVSLIGLCPLVPFDLYWKKSNGKKVLLKSCGDFCQSSELERWISKGLTLESDSSLNEEWLQTGLTKLFHLIEIQSVNLVDQKLILEWRIDFINWLYPTLWEEQSPTSRLDVCFMMGCVFYSLNEEKENLFLSFPQEVQRKNFLTASFATLMAIFLGYSDMAFLKEYFTILLFMDYPLCHSMWSESEKSFIKEEWLLPNVEGIVSLDLRKNIINNYKARGDQAFSYFSKEITHKSLLKYLKWSFARVNGQGTPEGLRASELSDIDILTIFLNHSFSYEENLNENPQGFLVKRLFSVDKDFKELNLNTRVENLIRVAFEKAQELKGGYLEIVGL